MFVSLTNTYEDFLPGSHQYLLTTANVFYALGPIIADGVRLFYHIVLHVPYFNLPYPRLPGVLFPNIPVVYQLPFVPDHKIWDGAITVSRLVD